MFFLYKLFFPRPPERTLAETLKAKGHKLASDGTDNHLVLWDLSIVTHRVYAQSTY